MLQVLPAVNPVKEKLLFLGGKAALCLLAPDSLIQRADFTGTSSAKHRRLKCSELGSGGQGWLGTLEELEASSFKIGTLLG